MSVLFGDSKFNWGSLSGLLLDKNGNQILDDFDVPIRVGVGFEILPGEVLISAQDQLLDLSDDPIVLSKQLLLGNKGGDFIYGDLVFLEVRAQVTSILLPPFSGQSAQIQGLIIAFGNDILLGLSGDDVLVGDIGTLDFRANGQFDGTGLVFGTILNPQIIFGDDLLNGGKGNDHIYGDVISLSFVSTLGDFNLSSSIFGGGDGDSFTFGNDIIFGQTGEDFLTGDVGDLRLEPFGISSINSFQLGDPPPSMTFQFGDDKIFAGNNASILIGDTENIILNPHDSGTLSAVFFFYGDDDLLGGKGHDQLYGDVVTLRLEAFSGAEINDSRLVFTDVPSVEFTFGDDKVNAGKGDDILRGDAKEIFIEARDSAGINNLQLNFGADSLRGGEGLDTIFGDAESIHQALGPNASMNFNESRGGLLFDISSNYTFGNDYIDGGKGGLPGREQLLIGDIGDITVQSSGSTIIFNNNWIYGNDILEGGQGAEILIGDVQLLTYDVEFAIFLRNIFGHDYLYGNAGDDILIGDFQSLEATGFGIASPFIFGGDTLYGGDGNDQLYGDYSGSFLTDFSYVIGFGKDILYGEKGDDLLDGGVGSDFMDGGEGFDTLSYKTAKPDIFDPAQMRGVIVDLSLGIGSGGDASGDVFINMEAFLGSDFNDFVTTGGNFQLINTALGDDTIISVPGTISDVIDGGPGIDTLDFRNKEAGSMIDLSVMDMDGFSMAISGFDLSKIKNIENVVGTEFDDVIMGNSEDNLIKGLSGNDLLKGGGGSDILVGGLGEDIFIGGGGNDTLIGEFGVSKDPDFNGDWVLTVKDLVAGHGGELDGWELTIQTQFQTIVKVGSGFLIDETIAETYSSEINISGLPVGETIDKVTVTLLDLDHASIGELEVSLRNPATETEILFSKVGAEFGDFEAVDLTLTLDDFSSAPLLSFDTLYPFSGDVELKSESGEALINLTTSSKDLFIYDGLIDNGNDVIYGFDPGEGNDILKAENGAVFSDGGSINGGADLLVHLDDAGLTSTITLIGLGDVSFGTLVAEGNIVVA